MADQTKVVRIVVRGDEAVAGAKQAETALKGVSDQLKALNAVLDPTGAALKKNGQDAATLATAYERMKRSLDPLAASEQRLKEAAIAANAAVATGRETQEGAARTLDMLRQRHEALGREMTRGGASTGSFGRSVQNTAFQVGDFAVQLASGTNAMRAASQQLPQLLGGFGVWGAVIGAAVAALGALLGSLDLFKDDAAKAKDAADSFKAAIDATKGVLPGATEELHKHQQELSLVQRGYTEAAQASLGKGIKDNADQLAAASGPLRSAATGLITSLSVAVAQTADPITGLTRSLTTVEQQYFDFLRKIETAQPKDVGAITALRGEIERVKPAFEGAGLSVQPLLKALDDITGKVDETSQKTAELGNRQRALTDVDKGLAVIVRTVNAAFGEGTLALIEGGKALEITALAANKAATALTDLIDKQKTQAAILVQVSALPPGLRDYAQQVERITALEQARAEATAKGYSTAEVDALVDRQRQLLDVTQQVAQAQKDYADAAAIRSEAVGGVDKLNQRLADAARFLQAGTISAAEFNAEAAKLRADVQEKYNAAVKAGNDVLAAAIKAEQEHGRAALQASLDAAKGVVALIEILDAVGPAAANALRNAATTADSFGGVFSTVAGFMKSMADGIDKVSKDSGGLKTAQDRAAELQKTLDAYGKTLTFTGRMPGAGKGEAADRQFETDQRKLEEQIAGEKRLSDAYKVGAGAVAQVQRENEKLAAISELQSKKYGPDKIAIIKQETEAYYDLKAANENARVVMGIREDVGRQTERARLDLDMLGATNEQRQVEVRLLEIRNQLLDRGMPAAEAKATAESLRGEITELERTNAMIERQKAAADEIAGAFDQAFDRVGSAITEAFVQGNGAAIDFEGIVKGVLSEILQEMIKLAFVNPLKNALFGGANGSPLPTAMDVSNKWFGGGLFGSGGGAAASGSGAAGSGGGLLSGIGSTLGSWWSGATTWLAGLFDTGGMFGDPARTMVRLPASAFVGAPRFQNGGMFGDHFPALLRRDEEVLKRSDPRHRYNLAANDRFGGPVVVQMNIRTPDVSGFRQSQGQVAAEAGRAIDRARRNR